MKEIKLYLLTKEAEAMYRKEAKQGAHITLPILERKISSLVYASRDRYYYSDEDAIVAFGTCLITIAKDEVTAIKWSRKNHGCRVTATEEKALREAYAYFGLDSRGIKFLEEMQE